MKQNPLVQDQEIVLTEEQRAVVNAPLDSHLLLKGDAGTGKTTAGVHRLRFMIANGIPAESILILSPQRTLAQPYFAEIHSNTFPSGGRPTVVTFGGLAQRMISLFWPTIAKTAGFVKPAEMPVFLTLETTQYYLATLIEPLLQQGYFETITIDQNRLYSQIIDNLNKSAVVGFPPNEIADRLTQAWSGKPAHTIVYTQAQECALLFRKFCFQNSLLDFSLQMQVFVQNLWLSLLCRSYLKNNYRHLIYENIEEDNPVTHDILSEWLPDFQSVLLIQDTNAGFRSFLGADPISAFRLEEKCSGKIVFNNRHVITPELQTLETSLVSSITEHKVELHDHQVEKCYTIKPFRFYPEVMDWIIEEIQNLIQSGAAQPGEIAILTPFLSDALKFSLSSRLERSGIPFATYRPSRSLRDEPAARSILTLTKLANPAWNLKPSRQEIRNALMYAIEGCDLVRSDLLSQMLYNPSNPEEPLRSFDPVNPEMQQRITFLIGERYEVLRGWIAENINAGLTNLDHFVSRLFGECLSQPGFGFHSNFDSAAVTARLIESARKFRQTIIPIEDSNPSYVGKEFIRILEQGILAAQSISTLNEQTETNSVFLSPAFSYLMSNRPSKYQFWIDIGSQGWWSRLDQPLTQPFVLNRNWQSGTLWTDTLEFANNQKILARTVSGLLRRCSGHVYMVTLGINEQGIEERGPLVIALQTILRVLKSLPEKNHV